MLKHKLNKNHPELKKGEVFYSNVPDEVILLSDPDLESGWNDLKWKTKRSGLIAYDSTGKRIRGMIPVFVQRKEIKKAGVNLQEFRGCQDLRG